MTKKSPNRVNLDGKADRLMNDIRAGNPINYRPSQAELAAAMKTHRVPSAEGLLRHAYRDSYKEGQEHALEAARKDALLRGNILLKGDTVVIECLKDIDQGQVKDAANRIWEQLKVAEKAYDNQVKEVDALRVMNEWFRGFVDNVELGKPLHSAFQQLEENVCSETNLQDIDYARYFAGCQVFLVQHNWAKLIQNSEADDGDVTLPADRCAFEVDINGLRVIALYDEEHPWEPIIFVRTNRNAASWISMPRKLNDKPYFPFMNDLVRATCIMLEARVAETEVVRAPEKLNVQRLKNSRPPLRDYHIVRLDRRHRVAPSDMEAFDTERRRPRLHFRRSHDRHYATYKVRIKWTLAGNPELGWVDKEYRL